VATDCCTWAVISFKLHQMCLCPPRPLDPFHCFTAQLKNPKLNATDPCRHYGFYTDPDSQQEASLQTVVRKITKEVLKNTQRHERKTAINFHSVIHKKSSTHGCNILWRLFHIFKQNTPSWKYRVLQILVPRYDEHTQHFGHRLRFLRSYRPRFCKYNL